MTKSVLTAVSAAFFAACASASIDADVARVRTLTTTDVLPRAEPDRVDPETSAELRRLLQEPLDADTAVRIALANNRELRAQLRDMGVERGQLMQAGVVANPLFEVELLPERNSVLELRVEYEVTSLILAPVRARAAASELEAARYRASAAVVQAGFEVRAAFYALQAAEARVAIATRALDAFAASADAATALLEAGNIRELDASNQLLAHERAKIAVAEVELERANARERLQRLLSLSSDDAQWTIKGELPAAPAELTVREQLEKAALEASLEMHETKQRLEALARKAGYSALRGWLPDVDLDVHALIGDPDRGPMPPNETPWRFGGGVSVRLPIFDQRRGTTRMYEAQRDALLERYYGLAVNLRSHARQARNALSSSHARAVRYQTALLPAQRRVFEQTLRQYNAMQLGVFQLLQARRDQLDAQLDYVGTLAEYWTARAAMDALLAGKQVTTAGIATQASQFSPAQGGGH